MVVSVAPRVVVDASAVVEVVLDVEVELSVGPSVGVVVVGVVVVDDGGGWCCLQFPAMMSTIRS